MANLSVVVITRNRLLKLKRCLESIVAILPGSEIVVVDNGSDDGTADYLRQRSNIVPIVLSSNRGMAEGRNLGIQRTKKDFVMILDDDAWIVELEFQDIEKYFLENKDVGIIAPKLFYPNGEFQESIRSFPTILALIWRGTCLYKIFPGFSWYKKYIIKDSFNIQEIDWAIGACQIIRKEIFDQVGLFDKKYFGYYDDVDFCWRTSKKGYSTIFWPSSVVYHEYARTSSKGINHQFFRHIASIIRFFLKRARILK